MKTIKRQCLRDCYDSTNCVYYQKGYVYEFEEGDEMAESKHFVDIDKIETAPIEENKIVLDKSLMRKTVKYLSEKHPVEAKKVDLRKRSAKRDLVIEIMKKEGTLRTEDEGKTMGEQLTSEREAKLGKST
jgi:hypothetical protein